MTVLLPNSSIDVAKDALAKFNHLIAHREIYAKYCSQHYCTLELSGMCFTVTLRDNDNASVVKDRIVADGSDLESYVHKKEFKNRKKIDETTQNRIHGE